MEKKICRRIISFLLCAVMLLGYFPVMGFAAEEATKNDSLEKKSVSNVKLPDNEKLFGYFVEREFYGNEKSIAKRAGISNSATFGTAARESLNDVEKAIYDLLKEQIEHVAINGGGTHFQAIDAPDLKTEFIAYEFGLSSLDYQTARSAFLAQFDSGKIMDALLFDCPFDLYWFDKTIGMGTGWSYYPTSTTVRFTRLTFSFTVADAYWAKENYVTQNVAKVITAKRNAEAVVANNAFKNDYEKLKAYKKYICDEVSYNYAAVENPYTPYGDPWQMIWAFDEDYSTNIVCEGYSKAFQYLCDLSTFEGNTSCISVTGIAGGPHMWNVVTIGGKNYLVDITNSDSGTIGQSGGMFLNGVSGNVYYGYTARGLLYEYDEDTLNSYGTGSNSRLHLSSTDYTYTPPVLKITGHPQSTYATKDKAVSFNVAASGSGLTYQWQYRSSSAGSWNNTTVAGSNTSTLKLTATTARHGYQYRCEVKDSTGMVAYSNVATLSVFGIKTQPKSVSTSAGNNATFSVVATGKDLTYQWQWRKNSSSSWAATTVSGNKTSKITVPATAARNGYQYRCVVTDSRGLSFYSSAATLTVKSALSITTQPTNANKATGTTATFKVVASGSGLKYQWQWRQNSSSTWANTTLTGSKTAKLSVPVTVARNGYQYRCKITDASGKVIYSNAVKLTVFGIKTQPKSVTATEGTTATFKVVATGTGLTYQWQWRKNSSSSWASTTVSGNKTATIKVPATAARNGYQYRCKVTDSYGRVFYTSAAKLTVR